MGGRAVSAKVWHRGRIGQSSQCGATLARTSWSSSVHVLRPSAHGGVVPCSSSDRSAADNARTTSSAAWSVIALPPGLRQNLAYLAADLAQQGGAVRRRVQRRWSWLGPGFLRPVGPRARLVLPSLGGPRHDGPGPGGGGPGGL